MKDFNYLDRWLRDRCAERGINLEKLGRKAKISRAILYCYIKDRHRPSSQSMAKICRALSEIPWVKDGKLHKVPLEEGLKQYTELKPGRPFEKGRGKSVTTRGRK